MPLKLIELNWSLQLLDYIRPRPIPAAFISLCQIW